MRFVHDHASQIGIGVGVGGGGAGGGGGGDRKAVVLVCMLLRPFTNVTFVCTTQSHLK